MYISTDGCINKWLTYLLTYLLIDKDDWLIIFVNKLTAAGGKPTFPREQAHRSVGKWNQTVENTCIFQQVWVTEFQRNV